MQEQYQQIHLQRDTQDSSRKELTIRDNEDGKTLRASLQMNKCTKFQLKSQ